MEVAGLLRMVTQTRIVIQISAWLFDDHGHARIMISHLTFEIVTVLCCFDHVVILVVGYVFIVVNELHLARRHARRLRFRFHK